MKKKQLTKRRMEEINSENLFIMNRWKKVIPNNKKYQYGVNPKSKNAPNNCLKHFRVRCVEESNRCSRFCRPMPSHSANAPLGLRTAKVAIILETARA